MKAKITNTHCRICGIDYNVGASLFKLFEALKSRDGGIILKAKSSASISGVHYIDLDKFRGTLSTDWDKYYGFENDMYKIYDPIKGNKTLEDYSRYTVIGQVY